MTFVIRFVFLLRGVPTYFPGYGRSHRSVGRTNRMTSMAASVTHCSPDDGLIVGPSSWI